MNACPSIEAAASPEAFIAALRRQADKCREDASELASTWQDDSAGKFWRTAANKLDRMADALAKVTP